MNNSIAAIILTYNEEKHISRCINSLKNICEEIFVIDSFSKDRTVEIAKELGVYEQVKQDGGSWANVSSRDCGNIVSKAIEIANRSIENK